MKKNILFTLLLFLAFTVHAQVIRGPYLQAMTSTSVVIRWRTEVATNSRVQFGNSSAALGQKIEDEKLVTDHEIKIMGLNPESKYFYSIGSTSTTYLGDESTFFETAPAPGTIKKYRFGVLGDCGTNSAFQGNVRDQLAAYLGNNYMNALILLGDNAYSLGTDPEYQSNFFNHYKDAFLKKIPVFPTPGNHDYNNDNPDRQKDHKVPYYDIFSPPTNGEAGGFPSGTKAFYSYDYGNVHFLSLDSYGREDQETRLYDTLGKQVQWIKADLAANKNKGWVVAYWHHPPFSQGSRNSETELDMIKIRENFIRILERNGVDLILCGHSHVYERTRLINGFYDYSDKFNGAVHNVSQSSGKYDLSDNSCPYIKKSSENKGTVYVVAGSGGQLGSPAAGFPHKAMYYSNADHGGSMVLEVEGNRLDAKWIGIDGLIRDQFTMEKDVNQVKTVNLDPGKSVKLDASFIGKYIWNTGETSRSITVSPTVDTEYSVKDAENCINDVFKIKITPPSVKLFSLSASANPVNIVQLKWSTEFENQFNYFQVERSANGTDYTDIAHVKGSENSTQTKSYEYADSTARTISSDGTFYYRLKMIDLAGKFEYSRIVSVKLKEIILGTEPDVPVDIEIVPNPSVQEDIQIRLTGLEKASAMISVIDISGKVMMSRTISLTKDLSHFLPKGISKGVYFLKAVIGNRTVTKKFMIL
ncbi:metallophosphoesterase [Dyadobacter subterraneus]|uniref:Metallophosphoesterase n=1 Tax=Dyadobacter subterraneus TaxID=2773304 RepID=A0ABR9WFL8_9BACT|nr:metallophosphoesterase [Dyadobacter subterraneus]MBE9464215.1 metallophosphoesterase [Dyadobacter subterraneus]